MIESMGITRSSSNCDSSEWGCSSTSKQPTLQHNHHMAGMENTEAVPSVPGDTDRPCAHSPAQLSGTTGHKTRPVPAPKRWQLQPGCPAMPWESPMPSPRLLVLGARSMPGVRRGAGPCITCQTTGQACPGALTRVWAHLGQHWEPAGHRNHSGRALCGSAQHSWHCCLPTTRSVISGRH